MALPVNKTVLNNSKQPLRKIFVLSEQVVVTAEPRELVTILGSCVAVCLWDKKYKVGGMNHFLLPETVNNVESLKGGIESTRRLIESVIARTLNFKHLEASVYGGANRFFKNESFLNVGSQNVKAAKIVLAESKIPIIFQDTGGVPGRKLYFNTETGKIRVIKIDYTDPEPKLE